MKSFAIFILTFIPGWLSFQSAFDVKQEASFLERIEAHQKETASLSANFKQTKINPLFTENMEATGNFYYEKPDKIRWEETEPNQQYIILNGEEFIQFDGLTVSKSSSNSMQASIFKKFILKTIDGSLFKDKSFKNELSNNGEVVTMNLIPTDKRIKKRMSRIVLSFNAKTLFLESLTLKENEQVETIISFSNQKKDLPLPSKLFEAHE